MHGLLACALALPVCWRTGGQRARSRLLATENGKSQTLRDGKHSTGHVEYQLQAGTNGIGL